MKKSVFLGKGLTMLFIVTMMLGVMLSAGRMEVSAAENDTSGNTIERSTPVGDGTEDNPYQIGTKEELYWFAALVNNGDNGACAVLTADITVNTGVLGENGELAKNGDELISWTPISKIQYSYSGIFDGQNHTISGLYFNNPKEEEQDAGLFRRLKASGKIINVGIVDSYFNGENYVGGVCGFNNGTIKNCYYSGTVNGSYCVGGICGENEKSIENCYHIGTVSGTSYVGSICGYNKADVKNCYYDNSTGVEKAIGEDTGTAKDVSGKSTKDMHSSDFCKLITYHSCRNITCSLCGGYQEATCNTDGKYEIGNASQLYWFADKVNNENGTYGNANAVLTKDIVVNQNVLKSDGTLNGDGISFKSWTPIGTVSYSTISQGLLENVHLYNGTFDGRNHTISGLYFNNTSTSYIGLFGYVGTSGKISNVGIIDSYFNGKYYVGSICGYNSGGTMEDCYNTANVSGSNYIGGICGYKSGGTIKTCYHTANVSSLQDNSSNVGGICGYNAKGEIISCYYDSTTYSGEKVGTNKGTLACVDGKTAEQFKSGEVTYLLQGNPGEETEVVWGQTLTGDDQQDFPVLSGKPVYQIYQYAVCEYAANQEEPTKTLYSNSNQDIYEPHKDDGSVSGSVAYDNKCDYCGEPCHSFNENGICEEEGCGYYQGIITNATYSTTVAYCGDATDAQPKTDDFTVASGTKPEFTWYKGDVTTGDLPTVENALGKDAPKELGIYTLVVNAAGAQKDGTVYTAAELRVKVTITKAQLAGTVTLEGTLKCNETVTVNTDDITHPHPGNLSYQWYRVDGENETEIATEPSYTLTTKDIGKKIRVEVYAENCTECLSATTETTVNKLDGSAEIKSTSEELSKYWDETTILTPTFRTGNNEGANNENVTFEYKKITDTDYTMTAPTDAGTYHVRVKVKADSIHSEAVSEPVEFTIAKVNSEVEVAPVAAKNLIYTQGKTVTLIDASNASVTGGQLQYALGENGTYSTALPTVTAAGTYSVYYKVVGDRNHNDTEPVKTNVTVSKAFPFYQAPTDISAACGSKLLAVQLPTGFEWMDEDVTLEAGDTETGIQIIKKAKYVPEDTKNYEEVTDIAITIQVTHDSELKGVVEPTCTEKGYSGDSYCKHCRKKIQSGTDVDALDHEFSKDFTVDTEATCKSVGSKSRHCSRCEEKTEITEIPKSDHAWDDGKITKEATETAEGVKTYSCKVCGVTRTETIPKKDAVATQQPTEGSTVSQSPKNGDTITDNKSNAKYTVTDTVKMNVTYSAPITIKAKTITIPATIKINGEIYKVTRIDKNALKGNKKVTKIVVGSNIQSIGNYAFSGCKKLKTIIIRSKKLTTKTVSKKAFKGIAKKVVVKVPKKKRTAYKKLLEKKGLSSKNRIKNY